MCLHMCLHGGLPGVEVTSACEQMTFRTTHKFGCWQEKVTSTYNCILAVRYPYRENMHPTPPYKSGARHSSRTQDLGDQRHRVQDLRPIPWPISPVRVWSFGRSDRESSGLCVVYRSLGNLPVAMDR